MAIDVLIIGTGEYVSGFVGETASTSDKSAGVIALCLFDLRKRGKIGRILLAGRNGKRFAGIRQHFQEKIANVYTDLATDVETWPADDEVDEQAYLQAMQTLAKGSAVIIVTPDDTHFAMAEAAVQLGLHVLVVKPLVKTLQQHQRLLALSKQHNVLVMLEVHKRFDPIYQDACDQVRHFGDFSLMSSYMSQPKKQLQTFQAWAGKSSDISYYLNTHHIDLHVWMMTGLARPLRVTATAATGVANSLLNTATEDTITLTVQWENLPSGNLGIGVYTASWIAPRSDVHSQQRFHYMGHQGEVTVDQAHRGYSMATDENGFQSSNPLFMKYRPTAGKFAGQQTYAYQSLETFVDAVQELSSHNISVTNFEYLPTVLNTLQTTAILEAGRMSLDNNNVAVEIVYKDDSDLDPEYLLMLEGSNKYE